MARSGDALDSVDGTGGPFGSQRRRKPGALASPSQGIILWPASSDFVQFCSRVRSDGSMPPATRMASMSVVSFQSLPILIDGYDPEGHLVLIDGQLAAVLARLDADANDPEFKG